MKRVRSIATAYLSATPARRGMASLGAGGVPLFQTGTLGYWSSVGQLIDAPPAARSRLGLGLALAGDLAFLGAPGKAADSTASLFLRSGNTPGFSGSWNNSPFFKNGSILLNSMQSGIFLIRDRTQAIP